jgi:folate-binding protein YgfZ
MPASRSMRDVHRDAGGVLVTRRGTDLVATYGDLAGEYDASLDGAVIVDLAERGVLEASGPKRQSFLQGMLSNDVASLAAGRGCRAALLTVKGHVLALVRVLAGEDALWLETGAAEQADVQRVLEHHRVGAPVRFAPRPVSVLGVLGLRAGDVLRAAGVEAPLEPEAHRGIALAGHDVLVVRAGDLPGGGFVLHVPPEGAVDCWEGLCAAGARPAGRSALDARRVEDQRPWYGDDVTEDNLLHETGLVPEVHSPTKGCYLGQETVARLEARGGNVSRALRQLRLSAPADAGATVGRDGRDVGRVTTAAVSPRFGPIALAYVHRSSFEAGTTLEVGGAPATVVAGFLEE